MPICKFEERTIEEKGGGKRWKEEKTFNWISRLDFRRSFVSGLVTKVPASSRRSFLQMFDIFPSIKLVR